MYIKNTSGKIVAYSDEIGKKVLGKLPAPGMEEE